MAVAFLAAAILLEAPPGGAQEPPPEEAAAPGTQSRAVGAEDVQAADPRFAALHQKVETAREGWQARGAALLLLTRDGILEEAYFGRYRPATTVPLVYASQWLSAAAILSVVDQGHLALDASVGTLLGDDAGDLSSDTGSITLRQLLSHTSGLPAQHPCLADAEHSLESCARAILAEGAQDRPGRRVRYGGAGYQVAGYLAERAAGRPWEELFQEAVAEPLGMTHAQFSDGSNPRVADGARASLRDFGRYLSMLLRGGRVGARRVLSEESVAALLSAENGGPRVALSPFEGGTYGLGSWSPDGEVLWSPGGFGVVPWVEPEAGRGGLLMTLAPGDESLSLASSIQQAFGELLEPTDSDGGES